MIAYLASFAAAGFVWAWFWRESGKPGWGRVKRPTFAEVLGNFARALTRTVAPAMEQLAVSARVFGDAVRGLTAPLMAVDEARAMLDLPVVTSDLVPKGKVYLVNTEAARVPITYDAADDDSRLCSHEIRFGVHCRECDLQGWCDCPDCSEDMS